jgi:hypothetical protein
MEHMKNKNRGEKNFYPIDRIESDSFPARRAALPLCTARSVSGTALVNRGIRILALESQALAAELWMGARCCV